MKRLDNCNPVTLVIFFLAACGTAMFSMHPFTAVCSLGCAVIWFLLRNGRRGAGSHFFWLMLFVFMSLINPLIHHNGKTALFILNNNRITLEALVYGIISSAVIIASVYWFRSFSQIMTSDKLLYVFGRISPKFALLMSMALRYIPLFGRQAKKINSAQKALGLYKDDNAIDAIRGKTRVFSVLMTWALENGIITADSMEARGYGCARRTAFSVFRFDRTDIIITSLSVVSASVVWGCMLSGRLTFDYYPEISGMQLNPVGIIACTAYLMLCLIPVVMEIGDRIKWRCLKSGI